MISDRRLRNGYTDLGPIQIPPRPQGIVLTDRADGTRWLVSFNTASPERLSINSIYSTIQTTEGVRVYEANDGPKMDEDGEFTIILRNGRIGLEYNQFSRSTTARDDPPPFARKTSEIRKLLLDIIDPNGDIHIGYNT